MAVLTTQPILQYDDNNGDPANGYQLFTYAAGGTTKLATYQEAAESNAHANPIDLNSRGEVADSNGVAKPLYLQRNKTYKLVLATSTASDPPSGADIVWTVDNITSIDQLTQLWTTATKTANYTVTVNDAHKLIKCDATSGAITLTFLAAATAGDGFPIKIKKIDSSTNAITLDFNASETGDGLTTLTLNKQYEAIDLVCDASGWYVAPRVMQLRDANGNEVLIPASVASAVNEVTVTNAATTNAPSIAATGDDTNVGLTVKSKGTGAMVVQGAIQLNDSNGNELLKTVTTASAVNEITVTNAATGTGAILSATGGDTNIDVNLQAKGTGVYNLKSTADAASEVRLFEDTDNGSNYIGLKAPAAVTANKTFVLPDGDGSAGQVMTTDGSATLSWKTLGWEKISTATASSSASISFTDLSSSYKRYMITLEAIKPSTDTVNLWVRTSSNNGSSYDAGASDYSYATLLSKDNATTVSGTNNAGTSAFVLSVNQGNQAEELCHGHVILSNHTAATYKDISALINYGDDSTVFVNVYGNGKRRSASAVNAIQLMYNSGNIASGTFTLYGLR